MEPGRVPNPTRPNENDLALIQGYLGYQSDDRGDTTATAFPVSAPTNWSETGLIGSSSDSDVYRFTAGGGPVAIDVKPATTGPDLVVLADPQRVGHGGRI